MSYRSVRRVARCLRVSYRVVNKRLFSAIWFGSSVRVARNRTSSNSNRPLERASSVCSKDGQFVDREGGRRSAVLMGWRDVERKLKDDMASRLASRVGVYGLGRVGGRR
jgi:hypothetical protein